MQSPKIQNQQTSLIHKILSRTSSAASVQKKKVLNRSSRLIISETSAENFQKTLYSCIKKLDEKLCKIKFFTDNKDTFLELSYPQSDIYVLKIPKNLCSLPYSNILAYLNFTTLKPFFNLTPWELLEKRNKILSNCSIPIEFYYNTALGKVRVQLPNDYKEFYIKSAREIYDVKALVDKLYDSLKVRNGNIVFIEDCKLGCIAECLKEMMGKFFLVRLIKERSTGYEESHSAYKEGIDIRIQAIDEDHSVFTLVYTLGEICDILEVKPENFDSFYGEIFKRTVLETTKRGKVELNIIKKMIATEDAKGITKYNYYNILIVHEAAKKIGVKYAVKFYQIVSKSDFLLITAEMEINICEKYFYLCKYDTDKSSSEIFGNILNKLTIKNKKLGLITRDKGSMNNAATNIQRCLRGHLQREKYKIVINNKRKGIYNTIYIAGRKIGKKTFMVIVKKTSFGLSLFTSGDFENRIDISNYVASNTDNFDLLIRSLYIKESEIGINTNLLTFYQKTSKFIFPSDLDGYKKVLEKWKMIEKDYCKILIMEQGDFVAMMVDMKCKIMKKNEIIEIYNELSYECIYDEITLLNGEIYLDASARPKPVLILSRHFSTLDESFISVVLRDHLGRDLIKQKVLVFDITYKSMHNRFIIDLETAESVTGIPKQFLVPISNHIINKGICVNSEGAMLNLQFEPFKISEKINKIQKIYRGYKVRKNIGKILVKGNNFLAAVTKKKISGSDMIIFAYIQQGKIRIEALDKDYRLVLYLDQDFLRGHIEHRKKIIEEIIFDNLFIDTSNRMKRLCVNTSIFKKNFLFELKRSETKENNTENNYKMLLTPNAPYKVFPF